MKNNIVFFDFDGVIVDTGDIWYDILQSMSEVGDREDFKKLYEGNPYRKNSEHITTGLDETERKLFDQFHSRMASVICIEGVSEQIKRLSEVYTLIIVSSTIGYMIDEHLRSFGLSQYFTEVLGCDFDKSKTVKIKHVLDNFQVVPIDSIIITDTLGDIREAADAGVKSIAVTWGFHDRATLEKGKPFVIIDKPSDISVQVEKYFDGAKN